MQFEDSSNIAYI